MSGEAEPRRSVRATKGQHPKSFDDASMLEAPKRRQTKKGRKVSDDITKKKQEAAPDEEIIRCVCGATEQDGNSSEPWIACDTCTAWQHNVCMGMSVFTEDLPKNYYCEQCRPEDHAELLSGIERGEKPWEERRLKHEAEQKRRRGGRKPKKRMSDPKDEVAKAEKEKSKSSPQFEASLEHDRENPDDKEQGVERENETGVEKEVEEENEGRKGKEEHLEGPNERGRATNKDKGSGAKRKSRGVDDRAEGPTPKIRKMSDLKAEPESVPIASYSPPHDLPSSISELSDSRLNTATALMKSLVYALTLAADAGVFNLKEPETAQSRAEHLAIEVERACYEHQTGKDYSTQARTLTFNLKNNHELILGLLRRTISPTMLATMKSDELASKQQQKERSQLRAKVEKQAILIGTSTEGKQRVRRTHKGEEVIEPEGMVTNEDASTFIRQPVEREFKTESSRESPTDSAQPAQPSPSIANDFDIKKVFSAVKSPTNPNHKRRLSSVVISASGPGVDPDVDRLLQDDTESPPYSPTDDAPPDPDIVWRGNLTMNSVADFPAVAKFVGGADLTVTISLPWTSLIPKRLTVAGRIDQQKAIEYLCGLRYADTTDIVVASIAPAPGQGERIQQQYRTLVDYFVSKNRYGVVGDKGVGNVRDTYLVPVPPGDGNFPEFMLNFQDNLIPVKRNDAMLLVVFVYRNDPATTVHPNPQVGNQSSGMDGQSPLTAGPEGPSGTNYSSGGRSSIITPTFLPDANQRGTLVTYPAQQQAARNHTPITPSNPDHIHHPPLPIQNQTPAATPLAAGHLGAQSQAPYAQNPSIPQQVSEEARRQAYLAGEQVAREVLGSLFTCPTVQFLLPQAGSMTRREWEVVKRIYEKDVKSRNELEHLAWLLEIEGKGEDEKNGQGHGIQETMTIEDAVVAAGADGLRNTVDEASVAAPHVKSG